MRKHIVAIAVLLAPAVAQAQTPPPAAEPAPAPAAEAPPAPAAEAPLPTLVVEHKPWTFGVAARVGLTVPTSKLGAMAVGGIEIDVALPVADHRLVAALDVSLTRPSHDGGVTDPRAGGAQTYTIDETELKVGLDALFRFFPAGHHFVPFAGAGVLAHMLKSTESTTIAPGDNTAQNTEIGFELVGGLDWQLGPGFLLGDVRVVYSDLDHLLTGNSNAGNITAGVGYRLVF